MTDLPIQDLTPPAAEAERPMRIWIDTEFNEYRGALISMALVAEDGRQWYEVLGCANPGPWVAANVMPILMKAPIPEKRMKQSLENWLAEYKAVHIVADWPEDIAHFCNFLITGPGFRLATPALTMEVRRDLDAQSAVPHNALADALAMRDVHLKIEAVMPVGLA
jgi:hypothetical protein